MLKTKLDALFTRLRGGETSETRPFQVKTSAALLEGKNAILTAPTGSGKTWAALLPFLHSRRVEKPIADRLIYALPLRSLAAGLYNSTKDALRAGNLLQDEEAVHDRAKFKVTLQTGEHRGDEYFQGDLIFTTIDQLLAAYLNLPLSLSPRLANINAGALIGSLIVLDEVHLLEPERALATVIEMSRRLRDYTKFLFMTATLTMDAIDILKQEMQAEVILVKPEELQALPSHAHKRKVYRWVNEPLNAKAVLEVHAGGRSIVVCNSVRKAQNIYQEILEMVTAQAFPTRVMLLHSRFFPQDRAKIEAELSTYFGPKRTKADCILVATQVVEAGLDFTSNNLHSEICPANALVQRSGRCARFAEDEGTVWIYDLEKNEKGLEKLGPYREKPLAGLTRDTRTAVAALDEQVIDFPREQQLVEEVLGAVEGSILQEVLINMPIYREQIKQALRTGQRSYISNLIRDVDAVSVFIHANPIELDFNKPWQFLSIPRSSLWALKEFYQEDQNPEWLAQLPRLVEGDEEQGVDWSPINSIKEIVLGSWLVCINPKYASYTKEMGLLLGREGREMELRLRPGKDKTIGDLSCETYSQHARNTLLAGRRILSKSGRALEMLCRELQADKQSLEKLFFLTACLHDTGKLSVKWQKAISSWQQDRDPEHPNFKLGQPLAHSTYTPVSDRERQRLDKYKKGNHALEGAFAVANYFQDWCGAHFPEQVSSGMAISALTAIARHHTAWASTLSEFELKKKEALSYLNSILRELFLEECVGLLDKPTFRERDDFPLALLNPESEEDERFLPLYWFLARLLRIADQQATAQGEGGEIV